MHDIKAIRQDPQAFDLAMKRRGEDPCADAILALDSKHRAIQTKTQELLALRNQLSQQVGKAKAKGEAADEIVAQVQANKAALAELEQKQNTLAVAIKARLEVLPNIAHADVPDGADENDNVEIHRSGTIPDFDFMPLRHFTLGEALGMMDFETAASISGARFVILRDKLARLERALANFMLDTHINLHGFEETAPPALVRTDTVYGTGQLPKFAEDFFHTDNDYWLIPTSEVPLTAQVQNTVVDSASLPRRYTAWTPCFRSEAGAAGRDTRGMIRQHQFSKVEMVCITAPDQSQAELEFMRQCAESILEKLGLAYRTVILCTGDMGFGATKTYDIEVWLPGENSYREISSCSNCWDFQARRMNARMKDVRQKGTQLVHSLNGSGLAVGRCLVAVLENYQQADGSVRIPQALQPYMGGASIIEKPA
ncbi:MAG: serine--tRNA ligase [Pseudomonadota bacterium]